MNRQAVLQALSNNNPFSSGVAGEPWGGRYPDVREINGHVHGPLLQLAQRLAADPHTGLAALILGDAGYGKTHLLGRLTDAGNLTATGGLQFAFAYVHPLLDPHRPFRHLLQEVIISLQHAATPGHPLNQLHLLLHPSLMAGWRSLLADKPDPKMAKVFQQAEGDPVWFFQSWWPKQKKKFISQLASQLWRILQPQHGRIHRQALLVLLQSDQPKTRESALAWLRGETLDDRESKALGVNDRHTLREEVLEEEARAILATVAALLVHRHTPLLVCFDRLENLQTPAHYQAFEILIDFLVGEMPATLPIALARSMQWDAFRQHLNPHAAQRLESNLLQLRGCSPATAGQLVESRLDFALGEAWRKDPHTRQALLADLMEPFQGRQFPREILATANKKLLALQEQPPPALPQVGEVLAGALESQFEKILGDFASQPPDAQRLGHGLLLLLTHGLGQEITSHKWADQSLRINVDHHPIQATLFVDANLHHLAVIRTLQQCLTPEDKQQKRLSILLREWRTPIPPLPKWPATNKLLQQFINQGGCHYSLQREEAASLYAISHLHQQVTSGDVAHLAPQGQLMEVSEEEFQRFIGKQLQNSPHFARLFTTLQQPPTIPPSPPLPPPTAITSRQLANLVESLTHVLESLPAHMGMANHLIGLLKERGVHTSLTSLLYGVEETPERFTILPSANGVIIQLRGKWRHEQTQR